MTKHIPHTTTDTSDAHQVDIRILRLSDQTPTEEALNWLSVEERRQANAFARTPAKNRYLQVRAAVRYCLSQYTGGTPQQLVITRSEEGKPELAAPWHGLHFNLSHCDDLLALAITRTAKIGIDVEKIALRRPWQAIAERYFHPSEVAELLQLPEQQQAAVFFQLWTLKEAFFKATGSGISTGLDKAAFSINSCHDNSITHRFADELGQEEQHWQFFSWQSASQYQLALALHHSARHRIDIQALSLPEITGHGAVGPADHPFATPAVT